MTRQPPSPAAEPRACSTAGPGRHTLSYGESLSLSCLCMLLDLFTQWDWSTYLADYGRPTCKYLRVNPHTALALLEK
ncbi:hypothetical protein JZ751_008946 [Albula glossodonta]|uniref:Uncharacterized protein n=1 Tax=Albula glossodonta TaxID=121402 RepID=A0A8T2P395_9TELE|nr:hypothetical protein JZ751_008946 [Albula glossodonta]